MLITIEDVLSWYPCSRYNTRRKLLKITGGRTSMTPVELSQLDIPAEDILWLLLRSQVMGDRNLRLYACDVAEHVSHFWNTETNSTWKPADLISVARAFANGDVNFDELRAAARATAWTAAGGAEGAARSALAARDAVGAVWATGAEAAATMAAGAADQAAAWAAGTVVGEAMDAARIVEQQWQLDLLREYLNP